MSICQGKSSWPELVGTSALFAVAAIESENTLVDAIIVKEGTSVVDNFSCERVWVWVNSGDIVIRTPQIG